MKNRTHHSDTEGTEEGKVRGTRAKRANFPSVILCASVVNRFCE